MMILMYFYIYKFVLDMSEYIEPHKREEFSLLQNEAKYLASIGDLKGSLKKFELAKKICPTPKVLQRIGKLQVCKVCLKFIKVSLFFLHN